MTNLEREARSRYQKTCRRLVVLSAVAALLYLKWLLVDARPDNHVLFYLLVGAELFNIAQAAGFWFTIWKQKWTEPKVVDFSQTGETVDIFITVCGEDAGLVGQTLRGALAIRHPRKRVWVLDDGPSPAIAALTTRSGASYLTRPDRRGAKAGNLNEALARSDGDLVLILDADHVPKPEFLERTLGAFGDDRVAYVQTPQVYVNRALNRVAAGAEEQQELFYGPIMRGKNARGAVFSCGTNVVFRRSALAAVGGMPEDSITEDLRVSLLLAKEGFRAEYVPHVLAEGIGPVDVASFFSQQRRWARGGLEILLKRRSFLRKMRPETAVEFSLGFLYWFTGWAYACYLILPIAYLMFGQRPVQVPNQYPAYFLPYLVLTLLTMSYASGYRLTFRGVWFTLSSFPVHIASLLSVVFRRKGTFVVTSKGRARTSLRPARVHVLTLITLTFAALFGLAQFGLTPAVMNNLAFVFGHILIVEGFVFYALRPATLEAEETEEARATQPRPEERPETAPDWERVESPLMWQE